LQLEDSAFFGVSTPQADVIQRGSHALERYILALLIPALGQLLSKTSARGATMAAQTQPFPSFETALGLDETPQNPSLAMALRQKLDNLPPLVFSPIRQMTHRRWQSDLSAASSSSTHSASTVFSAETSNETEGTEPFSASRSRSNTFWKQPLSAFSETNESYVPHKPYIKIILGTASMGSALSPIAKINTPEAAQAFVNTFRSRGYQDIDTARAYPVGRGGTCEKLLGERSLRLGSWSNISTKVSSFMPGSHRARNIETSINRSLEALNVESVDIMYLHAPDRATSFEETCFAMDKAYQDGKFDRFGLSNYQVADVKEILEICERNELVKPSVYQGQYNPICRGAEAELLALLRQHNIAFYAYSPSACGFFSNKISKGNTANDQGRWNVKSPLGAKYRGDYFHDPLFAAAEMVKGHAAFYGISGHAAALRWTTWHSDLQAEKGDAIIIGASTQQQLEENLDILEQGPLPDSLLHVLERVWDDVKDLDQGPKFSF
jgi:aflatoxin B1 aldehyde reductase